MLFTWDTTDLCIVFRSWHVGSTWSLLVSLVGVVVLCAGYELVRDISRRYEASVAARQTGLRIGASGVPGMPPRFLASLPLFLGPRFLSSTTYHGTRIRTGLTQKPSISSSPPKTLASTPSPTKTAALTNRAHYSGPQLATVPLVDAPRLRGRRAMKRG